LVICAEDAENSRTVVDDTLKKQKDAGTKSRCHVVSSTGLTTPNGWLVVFFFRLVIVIAAGDYEEEALRAQVRDEARIPHGIRVAVTASLSQAGHSAVKDREGADGAVVVWASHLVHALSAGSPDAILSPSHSF
jgi:putative copper export protein